MAMLLHFLEQAASFLEQAASFLLHALSFLLHDASHWAPGLQVVSFLPHVPAPHFCSAAPAAQAEEAIRAAAIVATDLMFRADMFDS
jgi:hypothetical protein